MSEKLLVLEIGPNVNPQAKSLWPDAEVLTMDALEDLKPDILGDASQPHEELHGKFDIIFASHVLEHFSYYHTDAVMAEWARWLKPVGELHIIVPALEWVAAQVLLAEKPSIALLPHLFGGQTTPYDLHLCMFTMRHLRAVFSRAKLVVRFARTLRYKLRANGQEHEAEQHYVVGIKG